MCFLFTWLEKRKWKKKWNRTASAQNIRFNVLLSIFWGLWILITNRNYIIYIRFVYNISWHHFFLVVDILAMQYHISQFLTNTWKYIVIIEIVIWQFMCFSWIIYESFPKRQVIRTTIDTDWFISCLIYMKYITWNIYHQVFYFFLWYCTKRSQ